MGSLGPGIADADRPRAGSFVSLFERIPGDPSALDALEFAYAQLSTGARRHLVYAVVQDLEAPAPALGVLLALESDRALATQIASLLRAHGLDQHFTTLTRGPSGGEACLVRPLLGFAVETMRIVWNRNEIETIEVESSLENSLKPASKTPTQETVAIVAPKLWRHLKNGGTLPEGASRFAAFFSIG